MSINKIRSELFKLLSDEKENVYSSKNPEEKKMHNAKYNAYNEYYMLVHKDSSFSSVFDVKDKLLKKVLELEKKYKELLELYEKEKKIEEKNKMVTDINNYVTRIETYNEIYNILNKNLKSNNNNYTDFSNKIIVLHTKIREEKSKEKLNELEEELYRMQEERRALLSSETSINIIKEISELESLESRISNTNFNLSSYTLNRREFLDELKDTIQAINEYYYLDYKKSKHYKETNELEKAQTFDNYVKKYYALISSAFKENYYVIEKGDLKLSTDDLINYISIYNLDENYEIFRSKNKNILIGNKEINKNDYLTKVEFLKKSINLLIDQCSNKIQNKNVKVTYQIPNQDELIELRDNKINEIETIIEGEKIHARR